MINVETSGELENYLKETGRIKREDSIDTELLTGGVSNKTVLVTVSQGDSYVIKQSLEKLRVEVDWFSDPARIIREADGIRALLRYTTSGSIPQFLFLDEENYLLAMEAVPQPHENYKSQLLRGVIDPGLVDQFASMLSRIHSESSTELEQLKKTFQDREFFKTLRLEPYYGYAATQVPEVESFMNDLIEETLSYQLSLVHGDYSPKNVLVYQNHIILLDHEVIHLGDPAFDCGFGMTHYLSKALHLEKHRERFLEAASQFWKTYLKGIEKVSWNDPGFEQRVTRQLMGCLLARVAGRSILEYLSDSEKEKQKKIVISLISHQPKTVAELIRTFGENC